MVHTHGIGDCLAIANRPDGFAWVHPFSVRPEDDKGSTERRAANDLIATHESVRRARNEMTVPGAVPGKGTYQAIIKAFDLHGDFHRRPLPLKSEKMINAAAPTIAQTNHCGIALAELGLLLPAVCEKTELSVTLPNCATGLAALDILAATDALMGIT